MATRANVVKRILVGRPMASSEIGETLLPKVIALPVFSSDPLSSVAYATQETVLVLGAAGAAALGAVVPISGAIAILLVTVAASYRQVCIAYPGGGGSYVVAKENLGSTAGLLAASALTIDYVMTVAVSTVAGVDAIVSAAPSLRPDEVQISIAVIAIVMLANLRGVRESGKLFAVPTYLFVASILFMILTGAVECVGGCPQAASAGMHLTQLQALTPFLVLRAFSGGTTALTGTEAISNGVPAFRYPQSRNAAQTLGIMAALAVTMFVGISVLAHLTHVHYTDASARTVVAQIALTVFGNGFAFYLVQASTALILVLAANTAFNGLPRLAAVLARDHYLPRHFLNLGDRLVYSNGIIVLAIAASLLVWVFDASTSRLIQLYLVGVFIAFTLSQLGMVRHWRGSRAPGWKRRAAINGFGGVLTGLVLIVVILTKFTHGAWLVVIAIPALIVSMRAVKRHLDRVAGQLSDPSKRPSPRRSGQQHLVLYVARVNAATVRALSFARSLRVADVSAVTFDPLIASTWKTLAPSVPLKVLAKKAGPRRDLRGYLKAKRAALPPQDFLTFVLPEVLSSRSLFEAVKSLPSQRLKARLVAEPNIQVLNLPLFSYDVRPETDSTAEPFENHVVVPVSGVNNASLNALAYASTLQATSIRAVNFGLDPNEAEQLGDDWLAAELPYTLELDDSPFRDIGRSMTGYVRRFDPDGYERVVTVVIPEVLTGGRHRLLHGQTALILKRYLLFERGVAVVSVPFHLESAPGHSLLNGRSRTVRH